MIEPLRADDLQRDLGTRWIGRDVRCLDVVGSTNDAAFEAARAGAPDGTVICAETQTGGRGRHGRAWASPRGGGLWCSVILRHPLPAADRPLLTVVAAVALTEAIHAATGLPARIRWPNDVTIGGRKVAGVLVEVRDGPGTADLAVLGLGLNVGLDPATLPADVTPLATSLAAAAGRPVERAPVLRALCVALDGAYGRLRAGDAASLDADWQRHSELLGRRVRIRIGEETAEGEVVGLAARTGVTLALAGGTHRTFRAERITRLEPA